MIYESTINLSKLNYKYMNESEEDIEVDIRENKRKLIIE